MTRRIILILTCAALVAAAPLTHATTLRTVVLKGQTAPGMPGGSSFQAFGQVVLNVAGHTAFFADTYNGDSAIDSLWFEGSGGMNLRARIDDQAPGLPDGVTFTYFDDSSHAPTPVLNASGRTAFWAKSAGGDPFVDPFGIWSDASGQLDTVANGLTPAPGAPANFTFASYIGSPALNAAGDTAFFARATDYLDEAEGIWKETVGSLELVALRGNHAPGTAAAVNFDFFGPLSLNDAGQTAFGAGLASGIDYDAGIWSEGSGELALIARTGQHAPGMPSGVTFTFFDYADNPPVINNAGQIAFFADTTGGEGIWAERNDGLTLVARSGSQAPGAESGVVFANLSHAPLINAAGRTAFHATLTGSGVNDANDAAIWSEGTGSLQLVAREGSQAPGTPNGVTFKEFGSQNYGLDLSSLNAAGQTAFWAQLAGAGVDNTNDVGIWATDINGALRLIARTGETMEVAPSDFRTISALSFRGGSGNEDGRPSSFNDRGQLAFAAAFTDGSAGVFVSNLVAHLPGDFNHDGAVDAADYVEWRKNPGGIYTPDDYTTWRTNFGQRFSFATAASVTGSAFPLPPSPLPDAVPEPSAFILAAAALAFAGLFLPRRRSNDGHASDLTSRL